jgi:antitoxin (DNA-binding transcriptional repressor) of toxin-antitoxin stability system
MKSVGVRELKSHLSKYLSLVKNGEVVVVTDHNKIVAEIRQPTKAVSKDNNAMQEIEAYLDKLNNEGKLYKASRSYTLVDSFKSIRKSSTSYKWKDIYSKLREDRF